MNFLTFMFWLFVGGPLLFGFGAMALESYKEVNNHGCVLQGYDKAENPIYSCPSKDGYNLQVVVNGKIVKLKK